MRNEIQSPTPSTDSGKRVELLSTRITEWLNEFQQALSEWEQWLNRVEEFYVSGHFEGLIEVEPQGNAIRDKIALMHNVRDSILSDAGQLGFSGISLTSVVRWMGQRGRESWNDELSLINRRLKITQQLSTALWLTGYQAQGYTTSLLDLIATGRSSRATYSEAESCSHEGGRLVDAAA